MIGLQRTRRVYATKMITKSLSAPRSFLWDIWTFLGLGDEEKWYATFAYKPNGEWNRTAEKMMLNFEESGHPVIRGTSPLAGGALTSYGGGKKWRYISMRNHELQNCYCVATSVRRRQNFVLNLNLKWFAVSFFHTSPSTKLGTSSVPGTRRRDEMKRSQNLLATVCEDAGFVKRVSIGQYFMTGHELDAFGISSVCRKHLREHSAAHTKRSTWSQYPNLAQPCKLLSPKSTT